MPKRTVDVLRNLGNLSEGRPSHPLRFSIPCECHKIRIRDKADLRTSIALRQKGHSLFCGIQRHRGHSLMMVARQPIQMR